jgi:hypothetical protein
MRTLVSSAARMISIGTFAWSRPQAAANFSIVTLVHLCYRLAAYNGDAAHHHG